MVGESMAEDQSEGSLSNTDQFICNEEYAPKARKPYTITKQRERWTQDDHKKFLEALKLHGRAWRRIQEHVGNKTAVQLRSHAQKFFSKADPIEIPPPRAKRKPMHPYPRKVSAPLEKESASPNSSGSDHEDRSPMSVLSAGGCSSDPCSPNVGLVLDENRPNDVAGRVEERRQSLKLFGKTFFVNGHKKGFVGYKRCLAEKKLMLTSDEREEQRVRLCL